MMTIPQASQRQLTRLRKLSRRRYRQELGLFLAEGRRTVEQLVRQGRIEIVEFYVSAQHLEESGKVDENHAHYLLTNKELSELAETETTQGVLALCRIPGPVELSNWWGRKGSLLAFDRIQDPGNLGTMIRTASWFGFDGLLFGKGTVDPWNPKTVRSTVGATGTLPYAEGEMGSLLEDFKTAGWEILLLDGNEGSHPLSDWKSTGKTVIVVGNEAQGIDRNLAAKFSRYRIEGDEHQFGAESLNAAVAASLAMYSVYLQK